MGNDWVQKVPEGPSVLRCILPIPLVAGSLIKAKLKVGLGPFTRYMVVQAPRALGVVSHRMARFLRCMEPAEEI